MPVLRQSAAQLEPQHRLGIAVRLPLIGSGKDAVGIVLHGEGEILPAGCLDEVDSGLVGVAAKPVGKQLDFGGKLARHVTGDGVPVPFIENEDRDHLDQDHRHQDN